MRRLIPAPLAITLALLVGLLAYLAGSHSATTPATAQAPIRWKMQTAWPLGIFPDDAAKLEHRNRQLRQELRQAQHELESLKSSRAWRLWQAVRPALIAVRRGGAYLRPR